MRMGDSSSYCFCFSYMMTLLIILLVLTPLTILYLNADPGISSYYRRALTMSDDNSGKIKQKHPIFTVINADGLHSHDNLTKPDNNVTSNSNNTLSSTNNSNNNTLNSTTTQVQNSTVSNIMMSEPISNVSSTSPPIDLIGDIHDASATLVKDWGLGWDSKIARVAQVLFGLVIYYIIMVIKGFIISWGIGEATRQFNNFSKPNHGDDDNKLDILSNLVNMAVNNVAAKFSS